MDKIVVMKDGEISEQGTYQELLQDGGQFADFLIEYLTEETQSDVEDIESLKQTLVSFCIKSCYYKQKVILTKVVITNDIMQLWRGGHSGSHLDFF